MQRFLARCRTMPVALLVAAFVVCLTSGRASAATYDVTSCNPDGSISGWTPFGGSAYHTSAVCPTNGDLSNRGLGVYNAVSVGMIGASGAGYSFHAPTGTSLVGIGAGVRIQRWDGAYWLGLVSGSGQPLYAYWANDGNGATAGAYTPQSWFGMNRESEVDLEVGCAALCDTSWLPGPGVHAWAQLFDPITVRIEDNGAPVETVGSGGLLSGPAASGTEAVGFDASDASGIRATRLYVDGNKLRDDAGVCNFERPVPCSNVAGGTYNVDTRTLGDGTHTVKVEAVDAAGNASSQARSFVADNTAPVAPVVEVGGGSDWHGANDFSVSWTNPAGQTTPIAKAHYQLCAAECGPAEVESGTNIESLSHLHVPAEGDYALRVWLEDAAGNVTAANASAAVHLRYDASGPEVPVDLAVAGGSGWRSSNAFDLSWRNPGEQLAPITTVRYRLCAAGGSCTLETRPGADQARTGFEVPSPGDYTVALSLGDAAGNFGEESAPIHLRFDDTDPGEAVPSGQSGWVTTKDYDARIALGEDAVAPPSGLAGFAVSLDGSEPGRAVDVGPDGLWHIADPPEGRLTLRARAISNSSVASSRVGSTTLLVDRTSPTIAVLGAPEPDEWQGHAVSLTIDAADELSGMDGGFVTYSIDGESEHRVPGGTAQVTVDADGEHTIAYSATDLAGNHSTTERVPVKLDASPPGDVSLSDPKRWLNARDADEYVEEVDAGRPLSGIAGYSFTTDGSEPDDSVDTTDRTLDLGHLSEGTTVVKARAVSGSGLVSRGSASVSLRVDRTAPEIALEGAPDADVWGSEPVRLSLKASDALSGMDDGRIAYTLDDGTEQVARGDSVELEVGGNGRHTVSFFALDAAGNRANTRTATFKLDTKKPGTAAPASSDGWITSDGAYSEHIGLREGELAPDSGLVGFSVTTDGSDPDGTPEVGSAGEFVIEELPEGVTTVKARAISGAGLASDEIGVGTIKVDRTAPALALERPSETELTARASDPLSGVKRGLLEFRPAGAGPWTPLATDLHTGRLTSPFDPRRLAPGTYDFRATAADEAGNRRVVTSFADGSPASVTVEASTQPAPAASSPEPKPAASVPTRHVRCSAKRKPHAKRKRHRHRAHHARKRKRPAKKTCAKGGEKHRHHHLGRKTHKPARKSAG